MSEKKFSIRKVDFDDIKDQPEIRWSGFYGIVRQIDDCCGIHAYDTDWSFKGYYWNRKERDDAYDRAIASGDYYEGTWEDEIELRKKRVDEPFNYKETIKRIKGY